MNDQTTRDILARLEMQEAELVVLREQVVASRRGRHRLRRGRSWRRGRWTSRLGAALVLALLLATVPAALLATDRFPDVPTANPHHDDVNQIAAAGITIGFPDGTYKPDAFVTRGQMASFLARTAGLGGRTPVVNAATALTANAATTAGSITGQANSATIPASSANTPDTIVQRDGSGNFAAGTITGNLTGNATSATNAGAVDGYSANDLTRLAFAVAPNIDEFIGADATRDLLTVTLAVPVRSYVRVIFTGTAIAQGTAGCPCVLQGRLRVDGEAPVNASFANLATEDTDLVGGFDRRPMAGSRVYLVEPGSHTFTLQLFRQTGSSATIGLNRAAMQAEIFPFGAGGAGAASVSTTASDEPAASER